MSKTTVIRRGRQIRFAFRARYDRVTKACIGHEIQFILAIRSQFAKGWTILGNGEWFIPELDAKRVLWIRRMAQRYADATGKVPDLTKPPEQWGRAIRAG